MKKNRLKRILLFILIFVLTLSLFACGSLNPADDGQDGSDNASVIIPVPDVPDAESAPSVEAPVVDETEIIGNIDIETNTADAVVILKGEDTEITGTGVKTVAWKEYDVYDPDSVDAGNPVRTGEKIVYGTVVEIFESGTYILQGILNPGFVAVSKKDLNVTIILNGVNIYCENYAAITCLKKSAITIELAEGSVNYLTDGGKSAAKDGKYAYAYDSEEQPNATVLIRKDLTICGTGKLIVNAGLNNGIGSRANVMLAGGDITVYAINNALKGNDSIVVSDGTYTINSKSDGVKTESTDDGLGTISITGGDFFITSINDAVQAATSLTISNAEMKIKTGGGSGAIVTTDSAKGLKAGIGLNIESGSFEIDSNDDGLHSDGNVTISGGLIIIATADDGIHADDIVAIDGGTINISKSYEGIEGTDINISGGLIRLKASDDGINISGGNDGSAISANRPGTGGQRPGQPSNTATGGTLTISGGEVYVDATGDGLDSNGNIAVSGGTVLVYGPTSSGDAPIDFDGTFTMTGGTIIALGSFGMAQQPGSSSTQYSFLVKFSTAVKADTLINVSTSSGTEIVTVKTLKTTASIVVCSPKLAKGSYTIYSGGTHSGAQNELGIYSSGIYSSGSALKTFTISSIITTVN